MKKNYKIKSDYLSLLYNLNKHQKTITKVATAIKKFKATNSFDAIAFTGTSGAGIAYPISLMLNIPLICVRKERSHSWARVEGCRSAKKYLIIDDFIETGNTIRRIIKKTNFFLGKDAEPVGLILYHPYAKSLRSKKWEGLPLIKI